MSRCRRLRKLTFGTYLMCSWISVTFKSSAGTNTMNLRRRNFSGRFKDCSLVGLKDLRLCVRLGPLLGITTPTRHRTPEGQ